MEIYEDTNIDTLDLLNEAYILRKHYFVKSKSNMILNAKSGICPEELWVLWTITNIKQKQRYALIPRNKLSMEQRWHMIIILEDIDIVMSGRGPSDKEVDHISNTVRTINVTIPQLKYVHV